MLIQHTRGKDKGLFFVGGEGTIVAEMTYTMPSENKMIIEHTEVDDSLRGKGIGLQLLEALVEYARAYHIKVTPVCRFARAIFDKRPELKDVLQ